MQTHTALYVIIAILVLVGIWALWRVGKKLRAPKPPTVPEPEQKVSPPVPPPTKKTH